MTARQLQLSSHVRMQGDSAAALGTQSATNTRQPRRIDHDHRQRTPPTVRRLVIEPARRIADVIAWSNFRRRHLDQAKTSHYAGKPSRNRKTDLLLEYKHDLVNR